MVSVECEVVTPSPLLQENGSGTNGSCAAPPPEERRYSSETCSHRMKRKLVNPKEVRKALKANISKCSECSRKKETNGVSLKTEVGPLSFCLTCGTRLCDEHAITHSEAKRTDGEHCFFWDRDNTGSTRCEVCRVMLDLSEAPSNDPIKMLFNELKSLMNIKGKADKADKSATPEAKQPAVLDKPEPKPEKYPQRSPPSNGTPSNSDDGKKRNGMKTNGVSHSSFNEISSPPTGNGYSEGTGNGERARKGLNLPKSTAIPAKGLSNLGNTCFFNSVMQCMMHTHQLPFFLERFGRVTRLNFAKPIKSFVVNDEKIDLEAATLKIRESSTPLNDALKAFIVDFRNSRTPSPNHLFNQIAQKAVRFRSMAQQDAHELLRYLLDGLCSEETARYQEAVAALVGAPVRGATKVDPAIVRKAKAYLQLAGRPLLDAVFGGRLLQTIRCSKCHHVSERYENFYDLSVPLTGGAAGKGRANGVVSNQQPSSSSTTTPSQRPSSKHQKKKEAKAAKQASRKGGRAAKTSESKTVEQEEEEGPTIEGGMAKLSMDDPGESETGHSEDEEKEERETTAAATAAAPPAGSNEEPDSSGNEDDYRSEEKEVDPLDLTKVLTTMTTSLPSGQSIAASLLEFTAEERLEGANAYECEKCCTPVNKKKEAKGPAKIRVAATKRYLIVTPPVVLTLHVKRFQQMHYGMKVTTRKVSGHVHFPLVFDIAPFCCRNVERIGNGETRVLYSLYGVVVHSGDLGGGHYVAYVKSRERLQQTDEMLETARSMCADVHAEPARSPALATPPPLPEHAEKELPHGQWYYCSDSRVSAVSESKVLGVEAYLLFYERIC